MIHRHLNHQSFTLAAIDDVISRGHLRDWCVLRKAVISDPLIAQKVRRICSNYIVDPYAQRYHFWFHYVSKKQG